MVLMSSCQHEKKYAKGMCNACYLREFRKKHPEKTKQYNTANRAKNGDKIRAYDRERAKDPKRRELANRTSRAWRERNIEHDRAVKREYYQNNKAAALERKHRRSKRCKQATPRWLSKEHKKEMVRIFAERPDNYHVDHIIPLRGKSVCGLNVPWNLQYLPAIENLRKGNKCK